MADAARDRAGHRPVDQTQPRVDPRDILNERRAA